jgi:Auxiliary Activity family 9 (formerly GH61)
MKLLFLISTALSASLVSGHAYIWGITVNGKDMGRGDQAGYIRKVQNNDPVKDVKSQEMTCNKNNGPASRFVDVKGGDKVPDSSNLILENVLTIESRSLLSGLTTTEVTISLPLLTRGRDSQRLSQTDFRL